MKKTALIVIDVQNALVNEKPYALEATISNIKKLIEASRKNNIEVIYIQHCEDEGEFLKGQESWQIYSEIAPNPGEKIIHKWYSSSFRKTELKAYLDEKGYEQLIITGMQTDYCVDTTVKVAFEYEYSLIIPEQTNTTFDNGNIEAESIYNYYNYRIFKDRFGKVANLNETLEWISSYNL